MTSQSFQITEKVKRFPQFSGSAVNGDALHSDCDSEGNDPPPGQYIDPNALDERAAAPPRGNEPIKLPFFQVREKSRMREVFESKVGYEDWVEETGDDAAGKRNRRSGAIKIEDDSEFPVGRGYFWAAYCATCNKSYSPHIPGQWNCLQCKQKVWQQPNDPESKRCAVCVREVAAIVTIRGRKIANPMVLNSHHCKRCGRIVCTRCYHPAPVPLPEFGYQEPKQVCSQCVNNIQELKKIPSEEDLGTLHQEQEVVGDSIEQALCYPYWLPKCNRCNITFTSPPSRWLCTSCQQSVWQPLEAVDSAACWLCNAPHPTSRCHCCGQLVCVPCGAYGQPLLSLGFDHGLMLSVCKGCYEGSSTAWVNPKGGSEKVTFERSKPFPAQCSSCKAVIGNPPDQWLSKCHKAKAWQIVGNEPNQTKVCNICTIPISSTTADNCRRCGFAVCLGCAQYKEPVPERGFAKSEGQTICKRCFNPELALAVTVVDYDAWPPHCPKCSRSFATVPERWRCAFQCGNVWQHLDHIASKGCWCCGKKLSASAINCRKCGRLVCLSCGEGRAEVPERGFTRGMNYPVCLRCCPQPAATEKS